MTDPDPAADPDPTTDHRNPPGDAGADALSHLQTAILEMVAASRAALEVFERVVSDPEALAPLVKTATGVGQVLADMMKTRAGQAPGPAEPPADDPAPRTGVQRIRVQ